MNLENAIKGLYQSFAVYQRRGDITGCPHCVEKEDQDALARVPLCSLTCDQISRFAFKAMTTWGEAEDYKHYLPRILELASTPDGRSWPGLEITLIAGKLLLAEWRSWPQPEKQAVTDYFRALWETVLAHDPDESYLKASEVLPGMALAVEDLSIFLKTWEQNFSLSASLQLADFILASWADLAKKGHLRGAWSEAPGREVVERWLLAPDRRRSLEAAFERHVDSPNADRLAEAIDAYQWIAAMVQ